MLYFIKFSTFKAISKGLKALLEWSIDSLRSKARTLTPNLEHKHLVNRLIYIWI